MRMMNRPTNELIESDDVCVDQQESEDRMTSSPSPHHQQHHQQPPSNGHYNSHHHHQQHQHPHHRLYHNHHHPPPFVVDGSGSGTNSDDYNTEGINFVTSNRPSFGMTRIDSAKLDYLRNSRSIGVLWAVFSACFTIINMIIFIQPQWLGDTESSRGTGYFGLFKSCRLLQDGQDLICSGSLFGSSSSDIVGTSIFRSPSSGPSVGSSSGQPNWAAFKAATLFVGSSVLVSISTVASFLLFFFLHSSTVFHICGWLQATNALLLVSGLLIFPIGWDQPAIREVCGPSADIYNPGDCSVRWTLILAVIGAIDVSVLALLSFLLGSRYVKLLEPKYIQQHVNGNANRMMRPSPPPLSSSSSLLVAKNGAFNGGGHVNGAFNGPPTLPVPVHLIGPPPPIATNGRTGNGNVGLRSTQTMQMQL